MPEGYTLNIDANVLAGNLRDNVAIAQSTRAIADRIIADYKTRATGSIGESAEAQPVAGGATRVAVLSPLAHLYEFGAPGHLYYGRGQAPLAARAWLRNAAESATGRAPEGGAE